MNTYHSNFGVYVVTIDHGKYKETITFKNLHYGKRGSVYSTSDRNVIKALESHPAFGRSFTLLSSGHQQEEPEPVKEIKQNDRVYENVKRIQEAVRVLVGEYNVPREEITTRQDILLRAEKLGVEFPNLH